MNQKFQNALRRTPQSVPPIWMMRQAGRYHRHYQNLRSKHSFMDLCKIPEVAAEVALGPIEDFDFDVAILFSDLLFPLEGLGLGLEYTEQGPKLGWLLNEANISRLHSIDEALNTLQFQGEALRCTREVLPQDKSLVGFVGGPWTLFAYAVGGSHAGSLIEAKKNLPLFLKFSEILVPLLIENIRLQLNSGAEVVMIFDTAAGELSPEIFSRIVGPTLEKLKNAFPKKLAYYSKGTTQDHFENWNEEGWAGLGFDHRWNLSKRMQNSSSGFIQGNFDQGLLFLEPEDFLHELKKFLAPFKSLSQQERAGWICGLGHGILPKTPEENVRMFVRTVRETFS